MAIKLLIGGSPCTFWSIAQKNNRETTAEGLGWELFKNYLIAKEKFKPDYFLYENNKSAAQAIKDQIKKELNVWDGSLLMEDTGVRYIEINSALVSAQNRQRFYVHNCGDVEQPEDRGILLKDILESGESLSSNKKSYCLTASYNGACAWNTLERCQREMVAEPINVCKGEKSHAIKAQYFKNGIANFITNGGHPATAEPIRVGSLPRANGELSTSQAMRIYSINGKSVTQSACGGGMGGKTGLYAVPYDNVGESKTIQKAIPKLVDKYGYVPEQFNAYNVTELTTKLPTLSCGSMATSSCATTRFEKVDKTQINKVYEVKDSKITIQGKQYPIKLPDGYYIIRKLTVTECERLQTLPDGYTQKDPTVSASQAYKGIGNGWTAEVIIHILSNALKNIPKDEEIIVLSMYDGIGTGRYCLDKMGFTNVKYFAYEIDKYAKKIALSNYPDIIQMGDAFQLRNFDWALKI